jgi:pilus assembly protein CpaB
LTNKSKAVFIILAGLALVAIGVLASIILVRRTQDQRAVTQEQAEVVKTDVVMVARDLFLGDALTSADLTIASVPVELAPRNVVTKVEDAVGKIIKTDLVQGEMLLSHNLADPTNSNNDLSFILSENHVLMAFPATDLMSRENMIKRGDIVDIFATFEQEVRVVGDEAVTATGEPVEPKMRTFTVDTFQRVSITALVLEIIDEEGNATPLTGQQTTEEAGPVETRIRAYLLALNPQDALVLKHLKDTDAVFDIVLRNPTSDVQFELTPVTAEYIIELYGLEILP